MKNTILFFGSIAVGLVIPIGYFNFFPKNELKTPTLQAVKTSEFSLENPPPQSIRGNISSITGEVSWQSRTATGSAKLESPRQIQQGEQIETGINGSAEVEFTNFATVKISPDSQVNFAQTLPANFVFGQNKGEATYSNYTTTHITVRTLSLLLDLKDGQMTVSLISDSPIINVLVEKGKVTAAYNDLDNLSHLKTFGPDDEFTFNDTTRRLIF